MIIFTLFFAGDEADLQGKPPLPFLKLAAVKHPWGSLDGLARCMAIQALRLCCMGESREMTPLWHWTHGD